MAEIVLGLAKSAVEETLSRVKSVIEEEARLKVRVQDDLVFITGEFQMMQSFLKVASEERAKNEVVKTWVRQVRDLAYDTEDCVEFVIHLDKKSTWWWRMVPSCIAPTLPLDEAVAEIKKLKARVEDVSQRNIRYSLISDSGSKPISRTKQPPASGAAPFDILSEVREAARKQRGLRDLTELIATEDSDLQVISVWGTGGDLGTTSIMRNAYDNRGICQTFTSRAWVKLMHPFNPDVFLRSLLTQFYANSCQVQGTNVKTLWGSKYESIGLLPSLFLKRKRQGANVGVYVRTRMEAAADTEDNLMKEFMQQVNEQRYLVVLEDISTMVEWDAVRMYLPDSKNGSRIVVSTQQFEIASLCTGQPYRIWELRQLSADHSVCVFFKEDSPQVGDEGKERSQHNGDESNGSSHRGHFFSNKREESQDWIKRFELLGREREMRELEWHILGAAHEDVGHHVIFVWGIAGVGKSALVRSVYYSRMLPGFEEKCSWVDVPYPFNLMEFSRRLLLDYYSERFHAKGTAVIGMMGSQDPIHICCELLHTNHCVIVIDGLRSTKEWDLIKATFLSEPTQASIVVITNEASVATHCAGQQYRVFNVKGLEADVAHELFIKEIKNAKHQITEEEGKLIVAKCGGLPKVIVDVGHYLARDKGMWTGLSDRFMGVLETNPRCHSLRDLFAWMHSYFESCPDLLKPCIFYLSIFPLDHGIRRRRLLRRWIAEGYSRDTDGITAEENGEKFFSKLVDLSIIQQPPHTGSTLLNRNSETMVECQVNGFFREYIISRPMEDNVVFALDGRCSLNSQRAGRHLTVGSSWNRDINVFKSIDFSRLRSLTVFGKWESFFISAKMRLLRVLDLEDTFGVTDDDLKQISRLIPRLKFLSLRGCKDISRLPSSLDDLRQLQTLDVRHTSIVMLPPAIIKLQKLQYIRAGTAAVPSDCDDGMVASLPAAKENRASTPSRSRSRTFVSWLSKFQRRRLNGGVEVPEGIGKLTALHTLGVVNVSSAAILKELKNFTQLRKLGVCGINWKYSQEFCSTISGHSHLESLSVHLDKDKQGFFGSLDDISQPPKTLKSLKLYGHVDRLPVWIKQLQNLKKLDLEVTILKQECIEFLSDIPSLENLCLFVKPIQDGELHFCLRPESLGFFNLGILEIACSSRLQVIFGERILEHLEQLKVYCYCASSLRISGLEHLGDLKEVWLRGSYDNALKQDLQHQLDDHPRQVKPVLKLKEIRSA